MSDEETNSWPVALIVFLILITGTLVAGDSLDTDKEVLLNLKAFFEKNNQINRGIYSLWNKQSNNPCEWPGINCSTTTRTARVTSINLSDNQISGKLFGNFSLLTELSFLDLSKNTLSGVIPEDLNRCQNLVRLNLSHNILDGHLNLTGLNKLEKLDISVNRICGEVQLSLPTICDRLVVLNISRNNFTGVINGSFDTCQNLQFLDLSTNKLSGKLWIGFERLLEFSASENNFNGHILSSMFGTNCNLQVLDLSENGFTGQVPGNISYCRSLVILNLSSNNFTGKIPAEMGSISSLQALYLGNNSFSKDIPDSLLSLNKLTFLDLSRNNFGGDIQEIFGKFNQVKFLVLHSNLYIGGIYTSGILKLPNIFILDLSFNKFSGPLPVEISEMPSLKFLILAYNEFSGTIPSEYGNLPRLQALDLSFNRLNGSIPPTFGKLRSLLWLMLANNSLSGEIPPDLGNCTSLLWLNLANNQLSGKIPPQLTNIGTNATATFESNRQENDGIVGGSGECLAMRRWIPANYPPFSFVYDILTRKSCRSTWDTILQGNSIFPICAAGLSVRTFQIPGYVQLSGNRLSGEVPPDIGNMLKFSMLHLGFNEFYGKLPPQIEEMPLVVLNISNNKFSGEIPGEIGNIKCLQNLDLSCNNFSGMFPASFNNLSELNKFNISYNPLISGEIPITGQFSTFEKSSYLGDPLLELPNFIDNTTDKSPHINNHDGKTNRSSFAAFLVFLALTLIFLILGVLSLIVCMMVKNPSESPGYLLQDIKYRHDLASSSSYSSPWLSDTIKVIRLDKTAFTHADILKATGNFSEERIIGKGGFGTVYRGVLPDGREVAVKKLQREGIEGEREFRAEMEVLSGNGFGWPHPNLVTLYGWCLDDTQKILVYEYMEGGSLEDLISDRIKLTWRRRIDVAVDVARALMFLHHECYPAIVHRDVKASNVLLDKDGKARVTDFGLARVVDAGDSHVSTVVAGTIGYVAPEYGQTWHATTKGDVYSFGVLTMELATGRRALDGGEECLVEWAKRVMGNERQGLSRSVIPVVLLGSGLAEGAEEMSELLRVGVKCTAESPQARPNMKEVLAMLIEISCIRGEFNYGHSPPF
ncbi:probable LRR receptor-like serine/threonine-protein kinase At1g74360 isoform X5 [Quercus robur]|uniref:probable LRR receptor-like serine/threonine-protein kinase At1g74360 isoform X5 n=1 Tax=Quercus robur TaxID=38942 RepID=UPI00216260ED|nr:probable LRR receptor-like serine/threonine-protein kinase At1g74360 isoform X5 [Quercus robur]XP_050259359.1 probable LRR receptor-like serine/threonine-protein kinase At1g74360 isoform X5 [Quercus robur]